MSSGVNNGFAGIPYNNQPKTIGPKSERHVSRMQPAHAFVFSDKESLNASYQFPVGRPHSRLGSVIDTEFIENMDDMTFNGMGTDIEEP